MLSSTSSSRREPPPGRWGRTWLLATALFVAALGGLELYWRRHGWDPNVESVRESWVLARMRVRPTSTVILGTSRTQSAIDPTMWAEYRKGAPPVMLAMEANGALSTFADIASDTAFHGHAIVEMMPTLTFDRRAVYTRNWVVDEYLAAYRDARVSPARRWEALLRTRIPSQFAFRRTELLPGRLAPVLLAGGELRKRHFILRRDDHRTMDFKRDNVPANSREILDTATFGYLARRASPLTPAQVDTLLLRVGAQVRAIQSRGGSVTFTFLSGCGGRKEVEDRLFPKDQYFNRLREIPGVRVIDSDAFPQMARLPCYDGSHIDATYVPLVTRLFAQADR